MAIKFRSEQEWQEWCQRNHVEYDSSRDIYKRAEEQQHSEESDGESYLVIGIGIIILCCVLWLVS